MASSEVDLANSALQMIGLQTITSLSDNTPEARLVNSFYAQARDETLAEHPWAEATTRAALAQLVTAPLFGFLYAYQKPSDFIRMVYPEIKTIPYRIESDQILSDLTPFNTVYIFRLTDTTKMGPLLSKAIYSNMAMKIATKGTGSDQKAAMASKVFQDALDEARFQDSQQQYTYSWQSSDWLGARYYGGYSAPYGYGAGWWGWGTC